MKRFLLIFWLVIGTSTFSIRAQDAEVILGLELGASSISVEPEFKPQDVDIDYDGYVFGYIFGYRFESDLVVEGNISYSSNDSFFRSFDNYELIESKALLGYSFEVKDNFRIVPMIGFSHWELETREGAFLNSGPEEELEFEGTDLTYKIRLDFPVGELVVLSLSYANTNVEFGRNELTQFGIKFEF
ncbi:MAG: outer membrane beta-barrel protein [Kangiellaceae bacterium]|jgi:Outer membrane protein beta-barrel domain